MPVSIPLPELRSVLVPRRPLFSPLETLRNELANAVMALGWLFVGNSLSPEHRDSLPVLLNAASGHVEDFGENPRHTEREIERLLHEFWGVAAGYGHFRPS